ncbi:MAG: hypothetical protein RLZZ185_1218, partial [Bacteroidota bacterium]
LWCNGNTPVFGSGFLGSSPGRSTQQNKPSTEMWKAFLLSEIYLLLL